MSTRKPSVSRRFRERTAPLWGAIMEHPFVRGIGAGDLSRDRYEHYLEQDYIYLSEFGRVFALASAKSEELPDMAYFAGLLHATLEYEMALHRRTCADFGITRRALERVQPSMVTTAYTSFLVRTCYEGRVTDILAALLPCETGYVEIAKKFKSKGAPSNRHYKDWIDTYSSAEFREFADWVTKKFDELAAGSSRREIQRWYRLYVTSVRFELLFFEMGWKKEFWPAGVPDWDRAIGGHAR